MFDYIEFLGFYLINYGTVFGMYLTFNFAQQSNIITV